MAADGVLGGIKVVDLSEQVPGPYATRLLAGLGADVIKVERPDSGDRLRHRPAMFDAENRGKRDLSVDLKSPDGRAALLRVIAAADVLVETYRPGVMDRLGLGFDAVLEVNPRIIYLSISGYGATGPVPGPSRARLPVPVVRRGHPAAEARLRRRLRPDDAARRRHGRVAVLGARGGPRPAREAGQAGRLRRASPRHGDGRLHPGDDGAAHRRGADRADQRRRAGPPRLRRLPDRGRAVREHRRARGSLLGAARAGARA